jgi:hypothetical protein
MHDQIGPQVQRSAQDGGGEGVVDQQRQALGVGDFGPGGDIQHLKPRIADGFTDDQARLRANGGTQGGQITRRHEGGGDAEARQGLGQQIDGAAIERARGNDVIARAPVTGSGCCPACRLRVDKPVAMEYSFSYFSL